MLQVAQVYMSWDKSNTAAALIQLVGFRRVFIANKDSVTLSFTVKGEQMEVWVDDNTGFNVLPGTTTPSQQTIDSPLTSHNVKIA